MLGAKSDCQLATAALDSLNRDRKFIVSLHRDCAFIRQRLTEKFRDQLRPWPEPTLFSPVYQPVTLPGETTMPTVLDKTLKRELTIEGKPFVVAISPQGFKIVPKGKRKGQEILWSAVVNGDAALSTALNASLRHGPDVADNEAAMGGDGKLAHR